MWLLLVATGCVSAMAACGSLEAVSSDDIADGAGDCLVVSDGWTWSREDHSVVVKGLVTNQCDKPMYKLDIGVQLEMKVGDTVLSNKEYAYGTTPEGVLRPGQVAPFVIVFDDAKLAQWVYRVELYKAYWSPVP